MLQEATARAAGRSIGDEINLTLACPHIRRIPSIRRNRFCLEWDGTKNFNAYMDMEQRAAALALALGDCARVNNLEKHLAEVVAVRLGASGLKNTHESNTRCAGVARNNAPEPRVVAPHPNRFV